MKLNMKIGYVGPFCDSNFGDYAMLVNDILDINQKKITIFAYNKILLKHIEKLYLRDYNISICEINLKENYSKKKNKSNKYEVEYNNYPDIPLELINEVTNVDEIKEYINNIDKLVVIGGGYFNYVWNAKHRREKLISIIIPIIIATQLSKKIVFLGNTYGPFDDSKELFSNIFNYLKNEVLASRDQLYSIANLRKIGYLKRVYDIPDDLYFLNDILKEKNVMNNSKLIKENYIILELYCSIEELENNKQEIINFAEEVFNKYNYKIYFLPFDKEYGGEYQAKKLEEFTNLIDIYYIKNDDFQKIEDILLLVRNAKMILCHRYHMLVFAIANNIPVKQILKNVCGDKRYYYSKSNGLLRQVFENQSYDERLFLELEIKDAMKNISQNLNSIIKSQKQLFNTNKKLCEEVMKKKRSMYIEKFINNSYK